MVLLLFEILCSESHKHLEYVLIDQWSAEGAHTGHEVEQVKTGTDPIEFSSSSTRQTVSFKLDIRSTQPSTKIFRFS